MWYLLPFVVFVVAFLKIENNESRSIRFLSIIQFYFQTKPVNFNIVVFIYFYFIFFFFFVTLGTYWEFCCTTHNLLVPLKYKLILNPYTLVHVYFEILNWVFGTLFHTYCIHITHARAITHTQPYSLMLTHSHAQLMKQSRVGKRTDQQHNIHIV